VGARLRADGIREAVVLADRSARGLSPEGWARRARDLAAEVGAHALVAEVNQGGDMVRAVLKAAGMTLPLRAVRATRGKALRAEPVAALYEQGRIRHAVPVPELEEDLMAMGRRTKARWTARMRWCGRSRTCWWSGRGKGRGRGGCESRGEIGGSAIVYSGRARSRDRRCA
jgi:phage terminase large subunit-like protein